jgi:hypothetical protein
MMDSGVVDPFMTPQAKFAIGASDARAVLGNDAASIAEPAVTLKVIVAKDGKFPPSRSANAAAAMAIPMQRPTTMKMPAAPARMASPFSASLVRSSGMVRMTGGGVA